MEGPKRHRGHRRVREAAAAGYTTEPSEPGLTGVLLDSDVILDALRGRGQASRRLIELAERGIPTYTTAISWAEVYAGIRAGEEFLTQGFFEARGDVLLDGIAGRRAGSYLARYSKSHGLGIADALIAAAATTSGLWLWTMNRRHYPMSDVLFYEP